MDGEGQSDLDLWARVAAGDGAAFGEVYDRHHRAVYNFAFRATGDWAAAEDLMSAVFLEAWRRRGDVALLRDSALPWLLGVASNVLRNYRRSLRRYGAALARWPRPDDTPDFADGVAARVDDERRLRDVRRALRRLSAVDREVLWCAWAGLGYEETALALRVPVGTVKSRLSRARAHLEKALVTTEPGAGGGHDMGGRRPALRTAEES